MKRIEYLDATRGFAIVLMVMAHAIAWNFLDWSSVVRYDYGQAANVKTAGFLWQFIYSFHMALFFMISGFLSHKLLASTEWGGIKRKTLRLFLPYVSTGFIILFVKGHYGYWFLFSIWELSLLAILFNNLLPKINKRDNVWIDMAIVIASYLVLKYVANRPFLDNPFCEQGKFTSYLLPFFFGYLMKKYEKMRNFLCDKIAYYIIAFCFIFTMRYYISFDSNIILRLAYSAGGYLLPIIGSLMCLECFRTMGNKRLLPVLSYIGTNSLEVYILHLLFIFQVSYVGDFWLSTNLPTCLISQIVYSLIVSTIAIAVSLVLASFLKQSKLLSAILFGKYPNE